MLTSSSQQRSLYSRQVVVAASYGFVLTLSLAVTATITIAIASLLVLNALLDRLISQFDLSNTEFLTYGVDQRVLWYVSNPFSCFAWSLTLPVGEFGGFDLLCCVLTFFRAFSVVPASVSTLWTSLNPIDMLVWLPMPSVVSTPRFASPAPRYVPAPSP